MSAAGSVVESAARRAAKLDGLQAARMVATSAEWSVGMSITAMGSKMADSKAFQRAVQTVLMWVKQRADKLAGRKVAKSVETRGARPVGKTVEQMDVQKAQRKVA